MIAPTAEFSRRVPLARLASSDYRQEIAAEPAECAALAARFGLVSLDRLAAAVALRREKTGTILLEATFEAAFVQSCVVTLEPVAATISACFALRYGPPESAEADAAPTTEEPAYEPLAGDTIDIGEAVAQELSLQLPPYPRLPDAVIDAAGGMEAATSPFAALAKRRGRVPG